MSVPILGPKLFAFRLSADNSIKKDLTLSPLVTSFVVCSSCLLKQLCSAIIHIAHNMDLDQTDKGSSLVRVHINCLLNSMKKSSLKWP